MPKAAKTDPNDPAVIYAAMRADPRYEQLCAIEANAEGNSLDRVERGVAIAQIATWQWALATFAPEATAFVEVGTNKGGFALLLTYITKYLSRLDTIDPIPACAAVQDIMDGDRLVVLAHTGSSADLLPILFNSAVNSAGELQSFDVAWIDGLHTVDACYTDLRHCAEAGVRLILVDDVYFAEGLMSAVERCCETFGYTLHHSPFAADDDRGIAVLVKE